MLFASTGGRVDHVAIYAGHGRMLHSSASGRGVGYDDLSSPRGQWFMERHVASRRVL
jgi:cell wall-associated NlpC family hydrolase